MNRKARVCLGIIIALLLGLFGQRALALCVSGDHLAIEVMGHPPCGPASPSDGQGVASGPPCNDILTGYAMQASLKGKRGTTQVAQIPTGGGLALSPIAPAPAPEQRRMFQRAATVDIDLHLHSLRTVVLLI